MNEIDNFKVFVLCSGDVIADVDHLHVKRIYLVGFSYIVIEDSSVLSNIKNLRNIPLFRVVL
jgi:hypothetical protein